MSGDTTSGTGGTTTSGAGHDMTDGGHDVLDALRDGWHSLGGGDAARCPGCPVCRLTASAGRVDPATAAHLQAAAGHLVSAGRELLAALARGGAEQTDPPGPVEDRTPDPAAPDPPPRTRIPVDTDPTRPARGNEEQA